MEPQMADLAFLSKRVSVLFETFSKFPSEEAFEGYIKGLQDLHRTEEQWCKIFEQAIREGQGDKKRGAIPPPSVIREIALEQFSGPSRYMREIESWPAPEPHPEWLEDPEWLELKRKLAS